MSDKLFGVVKIEPHETGPLVRVRSKGGAVDFMVNKITLPTYVRREVTQRGTAYVFFEKHGTSISYSDIAKRSDY